MALAGGLVFLVAEQLNPWTRPSLADPQSQVKWLLAQGIRVAELDARGRVALAAGRWAEACEALTEAQRLGREGVADAVAQCESELAATQAMDSADVALKAGDYVSAKHHVDRAPIETSQIDRLMALRGRVLLERDRLLTLARALKAWPQDLERMNEMLEDAQSAAAIDPDSSEARELVATATAAIEEIETPWVGVERTFTDGDVALAAKKAKACASRDAVCAEHQKALAELAAALPRLRGLPTKRLVELQMLAGSIAIGPTQDELTELIATRVSADAKRCRAKGDWACVDASLKLAVDISTQTEDQTVSFELQNELAEIVFKAEATAADDPKTARRLVTPIVKLKHIDEWTRYAAQRVLDRLTGDP